MLQSQMVVHSPSGSLTTKGVIETHTVCKRNLQSEGVDLVSCEVLGLGMMGEGGGGGGGGGGGVREESLAI